MSQLDSIQGSIQEINEQIAALTNLLNELIVYCPSDDSAVVQLPQNVIDDLQMAGITVDTTQDITGYDINQWIEKIQGQIDSLNNTQQLYILELQSQVNKQNEAMEITSTTVAMIQNANNSILNNMK